MKKITLLIGLVCICWYSGGGTSEASELNTFLVKCGSCHKNSGQAEPVNPAAKAGIIWEKYFKRGRHPVEIPNASPEDMAQVIQFLKNHAADSDHPVAAVIPK